MRAAFSLIAAVAFLAAAGAVPVLNLLVLGYLLEVQGRVARTGRLRAAFYLLPLAGRGAAIFLGIGLWLLPIGLLGQLARDARLVAPGSLAAWLWTALLAVAAVVVTVHLVLALANGGGWFRFFRPVSNLRGLRARLAGGEFWNEAHCRLASAMAALRVPHHLRLGLLGFATAYAWLVLPTLLFTLLRDTTSSLQLACLVIGGALLSLVLLWVPFLMVRMAVEGRVAAGFELFAVRELFRHSPFCWLLATSALLATSVLPLLYTALFKLRLPPHDARWDLLLVFLVTVVPARVLVGWAYGRATRKPPAWLAWQWINRLALCAAAIGFVYFLFLGATGGELGQQAIWQHHAVLLPFPF